MYKRIVLLIFVVLNLNIYSQVVIKDEIVLDGKGLEESGGTPIEMPFYGTVGEVIYAERQGCINCRVTLIVDGEEIPFLHCQTWECQPYPLYCNCGATNAFRTKTDVPQGKLVNTRFIKCLNVNGDYQWVELNHRFTMLAAKDADITYQIDIEINGNWYNDVGVMNFTEYTAPGNCPNAGGNYCDNSGWVEVPDIELVPYSGDASAYINFRCNEDEDRYAFFSRYPSNPSNLYSLTSSDVIACYNQIGQTWQFNLNQNMKLYYVATLCKDKIDENNMRIIYSLESIDSIDLEDCRLALRSFNGHKKYPYNIGNGGFIIKEVLLFHEDGHKEKYEKFMNDYFFFWETEIEIFRRICISYADIFDARKGGLEMYKKAFEKYYQAFTDAHDKFLGPKGSSRKRREEERVNNRPEMTEKIDLYIKKLKDHCNIQ